MSREYLLRLEAVNLASVLGDTQDLSTVRGGGLALLDAVRWVGEAEELGLEPVTTGASTGTFAFRAEDDAAAEARRAEVERFLRTHRRVFETADDPPRRAELGLGHATFVVDVVPATEDLVSDRERLLARNRWRQMTSPSLAIPEGPSEAGVCSLTRLRPATPDLTAPEGKPVSRSAYERREYGRAQKQRFYEEVTEERFPMGFSRHFEALATDPGRGILDGKMAVIYLDGNGFGAIQEAHCTDRDRQRAFDRQLREHRRGVLQAILAEARENAGFREAGGEGALRFETLLWGGDELLWVVPAWRGWWTLERFYRHAVEWTIRFPGGEEVPLSHAGGLLMCHHNAPIYRLTGLARELAEIAKGDRERSLFAYQVLESFDHAAGDLEGFRQRRSPAGVEHRELVIEGGRMGRIGEAFERLRPHLPHRQVVDLAVTGADGGTEAGAARRQREARIGRLRAEVPEEHRGAFDRLRQDLGGPDRFGLHLADLWDYLGVA